MASNSIAKRYTLTGGENTYSSPASVNEADARKMQSLIPSLAGDLSRERPVIPFVTSGLGSPGSPFPSRVGFFYQFKRNNSGVIVSYFFCATASQLYQLQNPGPNQTWSAVLSLAAFPVAVTINNTMHLSDSVTNWIFDGVSFTIDGLSIPQHAPTFKVNPAVAASNISSISRTNGIVTAQIGTIAGIVFPVGERLVVGGVSDSSFNSSSPIIVLTSTVTGGVNTLTWAQPGQLDVLPIANSGTLTPLSVTVLSNRYYWTTFSDQSATHPHESSSSPTTPGTGPMTNQTVTVGQRAGRISTLINTPNVTGVFVAGAIGSTDFSQGDVGLALYAGSPASGTLALIGIIASVQDAQHLTLAANAASTISGGQFVIAPVRATHWNLYASSSEEDKLGSLLISVPILAQYGITNNSNLSAGEYALDQSPMIGTIGSYFQNVQRPLLNDPPNPCTIMEVHKNRIWRNLLTFPNFFSYTGFEEILAEKAGTPSECIPGQDNVNTRSPGQVNETSFPDQSSTLTGIRKHGDALFIGTELNVVPLYGSSLADFQLSEAQAFAVGFAGRRASCSTPFGLAFLSYDLKVYLYPSQYSFGVDSTTALVELGRPKRPEFENIDGADLPNVNLIFYNWGRRNWLVLSYRRTDQTFATWVFDFEVKGWFQLQQGYTAIAVFETTLGRRSLIGAGPDFKTYVIDDLTGNFPIPAGTIYPVGYARFLLDFTKPGTNFEGRHIEFEKSNVNMEVDVTIWLDPVDPENPGIGIPIAMTKTKIGSNRYSGRPNPATGATCQRVLVEFAVAASAQNGTFRGFTVEADEIASPVL